MPIPISPTLFYSRSEVPIRGRPPTKSAEKETVVSCLQKATSSTACDDDKKTVSDEEYVLESESTDSEEYDHPTDLLSYKSSSDSLESDDNDEGLSAKKITKKSQKPKGKGPKKLQKNPVPDKAEETEPGDKHPEKSAEKTKTISDELKKLDKPSEADNIEETVKNLLTLRTVPLKVHQERNLKKGNGPKGRNRFCANFGRMKNICTILTALITGMVP